MDTIYMIGEVAQAHEGSIGLAHAYIDALATTGANAVKFQMHVADAESSMYEPFRQPFAYQDKSRFDYWKRMQFTQDQWIELKSHAESRKLDFIVSPFSIAAVNMLKTIGLKIFKIGSAEVDNTLILKKIAETGTNVIISSGMSSISELDGAIDLLKQHQCPVAVLQCTSAYPTKPHQWGLNMIQLFQERYQVPVGFSDHSGDIFAGLAAAAAGARLLEFHIVFDKRMSGPDTFSSLTIDQATTLAKGVRQIEIALNNPVDKSDNGHFEKLKTIFGKSLSINKPLKKGDLITVEDLECKKPAGHGISPKYFEDIIGKPLREDMAQWDFLTENHL